jgi:hypothetical protein
LIRYFVFFEPVDLIKIAQCIVSNVYE